MRVNVELRYLLYRLQELQAEQKDYETAITNLSDDGDEVSLAVKSLRECKRIVDGKILVLMNTDCMLIATTPAAIDGVTNIKERWNTDDEENAYRLQSKKPNPKSDKLEQGGEMYG